MLAKAESLLFGKYEDPIGATIGGYFLLRARRLARLRSWAPNLARFGWLPDGAVIDGWQHLLAGKAGRSSDEFALAREQYLLAATRRVPVYTEGLRLLIDGRTIREGRQAGP